LIAILKKRGDDFLKPQLPYDGNPRLFEILLEEAAQAGMPVAGHLPYKYDIARPSSAPLVSVEHDSGLLPQCSNTRQSCDGRNRSKAALLAGMNDSRCQAVLKAMAAQRIAFVPTHVASNVQEVQLLRDDINTMPTLKYVSRPIRLLWRSYSAANKAGINTSEKAVINQMYHASLDLTKRAHAAGVPILVGTDALDAYVVHGFSVHDELQLFVEAGLTPIDALRAATITPATYFNLANDLGTVEVGKVADLVLLNENPLVDIRNTRNIEAVWLNGRHLNRTHLDKMLRWTEVQANSFKLTAQFVWRLIRLS
jgi:Amidohydrolase family